MQCRKNLQKWECVKPSHTETDAKMTSRAVELNTLAKCLTQNKSLARTAQLTRTQITPFTNWNILLPNKRPSSYEVYPTMKSLATGTKQ